MEVTQHTVGKAGPSRSGAARQEGPVAGCRCTGGLVVAGCFIQGVA